MSAQKKQFNVQERRKINAHTHTRAQLLSLPITQWYACAYTAIALKAAGRAMKRLPISKRVREVKVKSLKRFLFAITRSYLHRPTYTMLNTHAHIHNHIYTCMRLFERVACAKSGQRHGHSSGARCQSAAN